MTIAETVTLVVLSLIAICKHTTFALVITDLIRVSSLSDFRKNLQTNEPQILVWKRSDHDVSKLYNNDLMHFAYDNRNELFDREIYLTKDGEFSSTTFFAGLEHVDINANNSFASVCIDMDQLIDSMRLIATENDNIICRLAVVSGVRCPKWHEDYVDLRLIKSYCGSGTDWIDPNDLPTRFLNFFRARADMDLIALNSEDIIHGECGDTIVIPGRKRQLKVPDSVPVLHRSPITEENCRRLLFTVTINAAKRTR